MCLWELRAHGERCQEAVTKAGFCGVLDETWLMEICILAFFDYDNPFAFCETPRGGRKGYCAISVARVYECTLYQK